MPNPSSAVIVKRFKNTLDIFMSEQFWDLWSRYRLVNGHLEYMQGRMLNPRQEQLVMEKLK